MSESQHVLLWSQQANDLRIEPLETYLSASRQAYKDDKPVGYVPIYVGTRAVVAACAGHCSMTLIGREGSPAHLPEAGGVSDEVSV